MGLSETQSNDFDPRLNHQPWCPVFDGRLCTCPKGRAKVTEPKRVWTCPRARSDMTPCVLRDGAMCFSGGPSYVCVGCGLDAWDIIREERRDERDRCVKRFQTEMEKGHGERDAIDAVRHMPLHR